MDIKVWLYHETQKHLYFQCGPSYKKLKFEWRNNSLSHLYPPPYIGCLGGCDRTFLESLQINISSVKNVSGNPRPQNSESNVDFSRNNRNGLGSSTQTNIPRQDFHNRPREFVPPPTVNRAQIPTNLGPRLPSTNSNMNHRMLTPSPSENGGENNVMCKCNKPASLFTVRKQNENQGKLLINIYIKNGPKP